MPTWLWRAPHGIWHSPLEGAGARLPSGHSLPSCPCWVPGCTPQLHVPEPWFPSLHNGANGMYLTAIPGGLNNRGVTGCWHANGVLTQPPASRQGPGAEAPRGLLEEHTWAATHGVLVTAGQSTPFMPYSQQQALSGPHHSRGPCHVLEHRDRGTGAGRPPNQGRLWVWSQVPGRQRAQP